MLSWTRWLVPLFVLALAGCRSVDPVIEAEKATLSVRPDSIGPAPDIEIDRLGSICWWNDGPEGFQFDVILDQRLDASMPCSTTLRFTVRDGVARTERPVGSAECAIVCFHEVGEFPYRIEGENVSLSGVVRVREVAR